MSGERAFWSSPYAAKAGCSHERIVEYVYDQPPFDYSKPLGGFVIRLREFACADCGVEVPSPLWKNEVGRTLIGKVSRPRHLSWGGE